MRTLERLELQPRTFLPRGAEKAARRSPAPPRGGAQPGPPLSVTLFALPSHAFPSGLNKPEAFQERVSGAPWGQAPRPGREAARPHPRGDSRARALAGLFLGFERPSCPPRSALRAACPAHTHRTLGAKSGEPAGQGSLAGAPGRVAGRGVRGAAAPGRVAGGRGAVQHPRGAPGPADAEQQGPRPPGPGRAPSPRGLGPAGPPPRQRPRRTRGPLPVRAPPRERAGRADRPPPSPSPQNLNKVGGRQGKDGSGPRRLPRGGSPGTCPAPLGAGFPAGQGRGRSAWAPCGGVPAAARSSGQGGGWERGGRTEDGDQVSPLLPKRGDGRGRDSHRV